MISSHFPSVLHDVESRLWAAVTWRRSCVRSHSCTEGGIRNLTGRRWSWRSWTSAWTASETRESQKSPVDWRILTPSWKFSSKCSIFTSLCCPHECHCIRRTASCFIVFLLRFSLSNCILTDVCCLDLAVGLESKENSLSEIDLSGNELHDRGVKKLCLGMRSPFCKLEKLS